MGFWTVYFGIYGGGQAIEDAAATWIASPMRIHVPGGNPAIWNPGGQLASFVPGSDETIKVVQDHG